jgi:hypothetical protein
MVRLCHVLRVGVPTIAFVAVLNGCDILGFDHSTKVARAVLYRPDGKLDEAAATAAMNARFPAGSKVADLESFVHSLGGRCNVLGANEYCYIPTSGAFCVAQEILLTVVTSAAADTIKHIEAKAATAAC